MQEIKQSEKELSGVYHLLLEKISDHIRVLAVHDQSIEGIVEVKRGLYILKQKLLSRKDLITGNQKNEEFDIQIDNLSKEVLLLIDDCIKKLDLDILEAVKVGIIGEKELKRVLIKFDYEQLAKQGLKYKEIKQQLSEEYGWSVSRIEKLVYRG
ncbi:MAG: hypothetical protein WC341_05185 [Bacteroidales bacterium]